MSTSPTLRARAFVLTQYVLPQHLLSRLVLHLTRSRARLLKRALIGAFVRHFSPDMRDARTREPQGFTSFNAFFTRELRAGTRPTDPDPRVLVSPVDGTVSQAGRLEGSHIVQAKGRTYTVEALLAGAPEQAQYFAGGAFATLYLAPRDYHRVHMPLAATLHAARFVPGRLFSVNTTSAASVPHLFTRNERIVLLFEDDALRWALVMVGALFVGSMSTVWHGDVAPCATRRVTELPVSDARAPLRLNKGEQLGRFNMGSTVILLLPPGRVEWGANCAPGRSIRVGETLGRITQPAVGA